MLKLVKKKAKKELNLYILVNLEKQSLQVRLPLVNRLRAPSSCRRHAHFKQKKVNLCNNKNKKNIIVFYDTLRPENLFSRSKNSGSDPEWGSSVTGGGVSVLVAVFVFAFFLCLTAMRRRWDSLPVSL